jgi:hypothetical protein
MLLRMLHMPAQAAGGALQELKPQTAEVKVILF